MKFKLFKEKLHFSGTISKHKEPIETMDNRFILVLLILTLLTISNGELSVSLGRVNVNEWFSKKIEANMFNLTLEQPNQFEYRFSLKNYPDLPSWMRFMYSTEYNAGFLYGTPPEKLGGNEVKALYDSFVTNCFHIFNLIIQK